MSEKIRRCLYRTVKYWNLDEIVALDMKVEEKVIKTEYVPRDSDNNISEHIIFVICRTVFP